MVKTYVLDTNVLLHSAKSMEAFQENDVVIPMAVIEELDKFKKNQDELGRNARQAIRRLDELRERGNLRKGVSFKGISPIASGKLFVFSAAALDSELGSKIKEVFRSDLGTDSPDNRILRVAYALSRKQLDVVFISKDINLRLKADALGLKVMDFENEKVDYDTLYTGFRSIEADADTIAALYHDRTMDGSEFHLYPNEFVLFTDPENPRHTALARFQQDQMLHVIDRNQGEKVWNILPRNPEQKMAIELLCNPEIKLVTLVGGAGTGKTLLALAAAMEATLKANLYDRILVSRPIIPMGKDIGYLPGNKDEKLNNWMQPIFDNLDYLLHGERSTESTQPRHGSGSSLTIDQLLSSKRIELEALTYIRGRSIPRQFVIVDEAQNLTPHEIKTIVSRAGEDTKMVLTGDPNQIDNPYLDASSNGLTYASERMKGTFIHGHIALAKSERSELAALAAKLL